MKRFFWIVLAITLVLEGCSSQPSEQAIQEAAQALLTEQFLTEEASEPTFTPIPTATYTPEPSPTPTPAVFTIEQVRELALQISDLQSGYTLDTEEILDANVLREKGATRTADYLETVQPSLGLDLVYERGTILSFASVRSRILVLPNRESASDYLQVHPSLFGDDLQPQTLSYDELADESRAYFVEGTSGDFELSAYLVVMRRGNVVAAINFYTLSALSDLAELDQYVRAVEARLVQAIPQ